MFKFFETAVNPNSSHIDYEDLKKYLSDFKYKDRLNEIFSKTKRVDATEFLLCDFTDDLNLRFKNPDLVSIEELHEFIILNEHLGWLEKMLFLELDKYSVEIVQFNSGSFQKI